MGPVLLGGAAPIPSAPAEVSVGLPAELLRRRPDIRQAERRAAAQCARIGIAESELYPSFTLFGSVGLATADSGRNFLTSGKDAGEQVPKDVYVWVKQDFGKIGDWEYLVTDLPLSDTDAVQKRLNELGSERWECIWIHTSGKRTSFIFKRPTQGYLRNIPLSQLMKLIPVGGSDSTAE